MSETITFVTCKDARQARRMAEALVRERLVACGNLVPGVVSVYEWEGKLERSRECLLILKSRAALSGALVRRVRELHTYTVPEVVTCRIASGNPDYLRWVRKSTRARP
jgi:periplasmic divalent cation tolerance protein